MSLRSLRPRSRWFRCIAYDLPSGREDGACLKRYTHADLVNDLWSVLDHLDVKQSYLYAAGFGSTVALAALKEPAQPSEPWWPSALSYGGLAITVGLVAWMIDRRKRSADLTAGP